MTIKDIARACGVSVSTVSRVLNNRPDVSDDVRGKVLRAVEDSGYIPNNSARDLVRSRSDAIGVIVRGMGNLFFADMLKTVSREIETSGYTMVLHFIDSDADEVKAGAILEREKKLRGLIFLGGRFDYTPAELALVGVHPSRRTLNAVWNYLSAAIPALGGDLLDHQAIPHQFDGDAGNAGLIRGAGDDGFDVIALPGEQPCHLTEDAGGVVRQDAESVELPLGVELLFHLAPPQFSRKSVMGEPAATMGRTISSMFSRQSMTAPVPQARAWAKTSSISARVVAR